MSTPREITNHLQSSFTAENCKIYATDESGAGGASHSYRINPIVSHEGQRVVDGNDPMAWISFQHGPVSEVGVNGCGNDALILILLDRLKAFNEGEFKCRENSLVITHLEEALLWLKARELERAKRKVLGTTQR